LQARLKSIESQLNEAPSSSDARSTIGSESAFVISSPKVIESTADSSSVTKRLEEELAKRDALIEVLAVHRAFQLSSQNITCSTLNAYITVAGIFVWKFDEYIPIASSYELVKSNLMVFKTVSVHRAA
jgi:hypothetical protein